MKCVFSVSNIFFKTLNKILISVVQKMISALIYYVFTTINTNHLLNVFF